MGAEDRTKAGRVTRLLKSWSDGQPSALDELTPLVYSELRRIAAGYLRRERPDHTLQPTALVHEAYLRLVGQSAAECASSTRFFIIAAHVMRQILVNHAERHKAAKRGGGNKASSASTSTRSDEPAASISSKGRNSMSGRAGLSKCASSEDYRSGKSPGLWACRSGP